MSAFTDGFSSPSVIAGFTMKKNVRLKPIGEPQVERMIEPLCLEVYSATSLPSTPTERHVGKFVGPKEQEGEANRIAIERVTFIY